MLPKSRCVSFSDVLVPTATDANGLIVNKDYGNGLVSVDIGDSEKYLTKPQPLDDDANLVEYHKFTKKGPFPCHRFNHSFLLLSCFFKCRISVSLIQCT